MSILRKFASSTSNFKSARSLLSTLLVHAAKALLWPSYLKLGGIGIKDCEDRRIFFELSKGRLEIGKPAPMVPTYLFLSGKKSSRSPPAEIFNSKNHAKPMNHLLKRPKTGPKSPKRRLDYNKTADGTSIIPIRVF